MHAEKCEVPLSIPYKKLGLTPIDSVENMSTTLASREMLGESIPHSKKSNRQCCPIMLFAHAFRARSDTNVQIIVRTPGHKCYNR